MTLQATTDNNARLISTNAPALPGWRAYYEESGDDRVWFDVNNPQHPATDETAEITLSNGNGRSFLIKENSLINSEYCVFESELTLKKYHHNSGIVFGWENSETFYYLDLILRDATENSGIFKLYRDYIPSHLTANDNTNIVMAGSVDALTCAESHKTVCIKIELAADSAIQIHLGTDSSYTGSFYVPLPRKIAQGSHVGFAHNIRWDVQSSFRFINWTGVTSEIYDVETILSENFESYNSETEQWKYQQDWEFVCDEGNALGESYVLNVDGNNMAYTFVSDHGTEDWDLHLRKSGIPLEQGCRYRIRLKARTETDASRMLTRKIRVALEENGGDYTNYSDQVPYITIDEELREYEFEFVMNHNSDPDAVFVVEMGHCQSADDTPLDVALDTIVIEKLTLATDIFSENFDHMSILPSQGWETYVDPHAAANFTIGEHFGSRMVHIDVSNAGNTDWHVQMYKAGITLEKGKKYQIRFKACTLKGSKRMHCILEENGGNWIGYSATHMYTHFTIDETMRMHTQTFTMDAKTDTDTLLYLGFGRIGSYEEPTEIFIDNIQVVEIR